MYKCFANAKCIITGSFFVRIILYFLEPGILREPLWKRYGCLYGPRTDIATHIMPVVFHVDS